MENTRWKVYISEPPLLVLVEQPAVFIALKRLPEGGDHFRWNDIRWRVRDVGLSEQDDFGVFRLVEAVSAPLPVFHECPGCGGLIQCSDYCRVGLHRDATPLPTIQASAPRPRKSRSGMLDAPLRDIVDRRGNLEELECGHFVHYRYFKFVDKTATQRRCLECCTACGPEVVRTVKRPRIT